MYSFISIVPLVALGFCAMTFLARGTDNAVARRVMLGRVEAVAPAQNGGAKPGSKGGKKDAKGKTASKPLNFAWPTSGRRIVEGYGERTNPRTGTVTVNPGINIAARSGSAVKAAERGTVSLISWLPSYGTILILQHRDGYRTVYGNLASTSVSKGASVKLGERIGNVAKTSGTTFVHFEVWQDQTRLDPVTVLPKK